MQTLKPPTIKKARKIHWKELNFLPLISTQTDIYLHENILDKDECLETNAMFIAVPFKLLNWNILYCKFSFLSHIISASVFRDLSINLIEPHSVRTKFNWLHCSNLQHVTKWRLHGRPYIKKSIWVHLSYKNPVCQAWFTYEL
jgi:hypothetical protein